jgi:hypothetical protein
VYKRSKVEIAPREYRMFNYPVGILYASMLPNVIDGFEQSQYCVSTVCSYLYSPWENIQNRIGRTFYVANYDLVN